MKQSTGCTTQALVALRRLSLTTLLVAALVSGCSEAGKTAGSGNDVLTDRGISFREVGSYVNDIYFALAATRSPIEVREIVVELRANCAGASPADPKFTSDDVIVAAQVSFPKDTDLMRDQQAIQYFYSHRMGKHFALPHVDRRLDLPPAVDAVPRTLHPGQETFVRLPLSILDECPTLPDDLVATAIIRRSDQPDSVFRMTGVIEKARNSVLRAAPVDSMR